MLRVLAERLVRATAPPNIKSRWRRRKGDYLVKTARLTDGEILHFLVGRVPDQESPEDEQFYKSFQSIRAQTLKSAMWLVASGAFGILAHFHSLQSASSNGLVVSSTVFSHAAMLAISASFAWFCFSFCKQSFIQSWFSAKMRNGPPNLKAKILLKYPEAFFHFSFFPGAIGYPANLQSDVKGYGQLFSLALLLMALSLFAGGSWLLWLTIAVDVWKSTQVSKLGAVLVLALSSILVLLGLTSPLRRDNPKQYKHYGLVNQLVKLKEDDQRRAHLRIYSAAVRMNLLNHDD